MPQKPQSCSLMELSNQNLSFPYLNADFHLAGPVLSSCWARGHYCRLQQCLAGGQEPARPSQGDAAHASARMKRPLGRSSLWQAWSQVPLWDQLVRLVQSHKRCSDLIRAASGDCADILLWLVLLDPSCARAERWKSSCWEEREEVRGEEKAVIADDEEHQQEQKSEQSLYRGRVGGDEALQWRDGAEKERSGLSACVSLIVNNNDYKQELSVVTVA